MWEIDPLKENVMDKFLQQIPLSLKIFAGVSLAGTVLFATVVFQGVSARHEPGSSRSLAEAGEVRQASYSDGGRSQALSQWKAQQAQLQAAMQQCQMQMNQMNYQMQQAAISGSGLMPPPPPCEQYMPGWIAQEAVAERNIHALETGDTSSDVYGVTGIPRPSSDGVGGSSASGGGSTDDGTAAVEDWDRGAIRETGIYAGEDGEQYELSNNGYHYKDRNSGEIVTTNSPDAPNDGHDYETLRPVQRPQ